MPGIAITEPHGGSQVRATQTTATPGRGGTWAVTGTKTWISRLTEAAVFCVFFTDPGGRLCAAVIDAASPGLARRPIAPAGLSGWAWGELRLHAVTVRPCDILGEPGEGMRLLREHFARYRPLVAATALGAAAGVHDHTTARLDARRQAGTITGPRDNALITLGRTYIQINAALLAALTAQRLAEAHSPLAQLWGCAAKAHGTDAAYETASELALLTGAAGFTADSGTAKARRDLNALLHADGIHDSLYRSAGRSLTQPGRQSAYAADPLPIVTTWGVPALGARRSPDRDQAAGPPFSRAATIPAARASRQAAIRRASNGVTRLATSPGSVKANPASSPSASTTAPISAADSTPPS